MSEWWKILAIGLSKGGRSPKSAHPMAAKGMPFPWRWDGDTISTNFDDIWDISAEIMTPNSPLKKAPLTEFHAAAKHIAAKAVSPSSETMRTT